MSMEDCVGSKTVAVGRRGLTMRAGRNSTHQTPRRSPVGGTGPSPICRMGSSGRSARSIVMSGRKRGSISSIHRSEPRKSHAVYAVLPFSRRTTHAGSRDVAIAAAVRTELAMSQAFDNWMSIDSRTSTPSRFSPVASESFGSLRLSALAIRSARRSARSAGTAKRQETCGRGDAADRDQRCKFTANGRSGGPPPTKCLGATLGDPSSNPPASRQTHAVILSSSWGVALTPAVAKASRTRLNSDPAGSVPSRRS